MVAGLRGLFGRKAEIEVALDSDAYLPGQTVTATIRVVSKKDLELEGGRAELVCENEYEYREEDLTSDRINDVDTHTATERTVHGSERFLEAGTLEGGAPSVHSLTLTVPADAVPTGKGAITEVRWKVVAILGRARALDPDAEAALQVLSPPDAYAETAQDAPRLDTHGDCDLELRLPNGPDIRAGEVVSGSIVVTPRLEIDAGEVRVEIVRREEVPRDEGNEEEAVDASSVVGEATGLSTMIPREYPFELTLPAGVCPSLQTKHSTVSWELRGVISRRMRSDYNVCQSLNVYTGPPGDVELVQEDSSTGLDVFKELPGGG